MVWSKAAKNVLHIKPKKTMPMRFFGTTCSSSFFHDAPGFSFTGDGGSAVAVICESRVARGQRGKNGLRGGVRRKWVHILRLCLYNKGSRDVLELCRRAPRCRVRARGFADSGFRPRIPSPSRLVTRKCDRKLIYGTPYSCSRKMVVSSAAGRVSGVKFIRSTRTTTCQLFVRIIFSPGEASRKCLVHKLFHGP